MASSLTSDVLTLSDVDLTSGESGVIATTTDGTAFITENMAAYSTGSWALSMGSNCKLIIMANTARSGDYTATFAYGTWHMYKARGLSNFYADASNNITSVTLGAACFGVAIRVS